MKAIAVRPGTPDSVHLAALAKPSLEDIPGGRGVLVKVLRVGVDGTDKEINAAEYGAAPAGYDFLVLGHESFGRVEATGSNVTELQPGDFVVATVRRPGTSIYDQIGTNDMAEVHTEDTDIIYVLEGAAVFVTGGDVVDPKTVSDGEIRGTAVRNGETRTISKGDVLVVPNGVPHWFENVFGPLNYYVVKVHRARNGRSE